MIIAGRLRIETWEKEAVKHRKLVVHADSVRFIGKDESPANPPARTGSSGIAPTDDKPNDAPQS